MYVPPIVLTFNLGISCHLLLKIQKSATFDTILDFPFAYMADATAAPSDSFTPSILKRVQLDDLKISAAPQGETLAAPRPLSPRSVQSSHNCRACSDKGSIYQGSPCGEPGRIQLPFGLMVKPQRPKLVNVDEFRRSLEGLAQTIASKQPGAVSPTGPHVHVSHPDRLSASPLIEALAKAADERVSQPSSAHASTPATPSDHSSGTAPMRLPPIPPVKCGAASRRSSLGSDRRGKGLRFDGQTSTRSLPITPVTSAAPVGSALLTIHGTVRLVRIVEKMSARKILRAWRKHRARQSRRPSLKPDKNMKSLMKDVVLSALSNSRLIRDELMGLRNEMGRQSPARPPLVPPLALPGVPSGNPPFKSVRVLLGPSVQSPAMMDKFIDDITAGRGRNGVRLCVGQPTLHPKAFVVVILMESLTVEEWESRIANCYYVYAYDRAFPLYQSTVPGLPWEIRVRTDMTQVAPQWVQTGGASLVHNSGG